MSSDERGPSRLQNLFKSGGRAFSLRVHRKPGEDNGPGTAQPGELLSPASGSVAGRISEEATDPGSFDGPANSASSMAPPRSGAAAAGPAAAAFPDDVDPGGSGGGGSASATTTGGGGGSGGGGAPAAGGAGAGPGLAAGVGGAGGGLMAQAPIPEHRVRKFHKLLEAPVVDLDALRELSWSGVPLALRPQVWRLLCGYLPLARTRQASTLARRRREYADMVPEYYAIPDSERSEDEQAAFRQVGVDVPRTAPGVPFFHTDIVQRSLHRLLYIWGIRHPASGYVQGMNDLVTPFLAVFLSEHLPGPMEGWAAAAVTEPIMLAVEADCYWCLCKLIEGIQDHYTYAQPGIQRAVFRIKELVRRCEADVSDHLESEAVDFIQFALRWVNCLLVRELPFALAIRLWDTYLAEGTGFSEFLVYISAAFLLSWRDRLTRLEFQELLLFLQRLPTADWTEAQLERVLSEAFILRSSYSDAQSHLRLG
ncbi:hypothetical protein HYH03_007292 [Edaphochlamys debaryana]|uniref:Rab-GAP TBC domain-containing protein n=1 Tax=Edaphochlamys debaryana TaxID=47281 RepID=A0A835Y8U2_9CHLO|nr:hypothetical protein HYH03_007292 [Edaphochlamys debaryana]|eukprot:KAG2494525.1 hypothetical protein HYH03_007292 [Edaphochlamys debaryana]